GTDYFPDMLAGRLSVDSENDLAIVCSKSINYEQNPDMVSTDWFTRGLMVYDYGGSLSCQNVKNRCRDLMLTHGYATVDTVTNPPNYYGGSLINPIINAGISFINYRGYGSYSSWTPPNYSISDMYSLDNGFRLPVVTSIVCGGGNFVSTSSDPCFGEYWIRRGSSPNTVSGGVAFMGPTSLYTHTKWNNCIDGGIYQGIFEEGIEDVASALLRGKMELYYGMPNNLGSGGTTSSVECYFHIYNILGDPGLRMWTGIPQVLTVDHPSELALGVNAFDASVAISGVPGEGALICLYNQTTGYQIYDWADENGDVLFDLAGTDAGAYTLTVTGKNLKPYQTTVTIAQEDVALGISNCVIDDDNVGESSGDGDGDVNPGETIEMAVILENTGSSVTASGINGSISCDDPYLEITENTLSGTSAIPGGTCQLNDDFNLVISPEAPHTHELPIYLEATCNEGSWTNLVTLEVVAPLAECLDYEVATVSGLLNPGEQADVTIELKSSGGDPLSNCTATLTSPDGKLVVVDADGSWGTLQPGTSASNSGNPFTLQATTSCPPGWVIPLELTVTSDGYCDTLTVSFIVGEIIDTDPAGPDSYGYRCFDSRDVGYAQVPLYDWVEASAMPGQETLNLPDYGNEDDKSIAHQLPFSFRYYGVDYNEITICSNGWLSMGDSHNYISFRNWNIPGALGPPAMIAGFWDDLRQVYGVTSVNYWFDSDNHRVLVEWKDLRTASGSGINRFEIILYDPAYYPTSTGDGNILVQYHTFNNVDASENYCTIGIENWEQSDGVNVTYASHYSRGSAILTAGVALLYTTDIDYSTGAPDVQVSLTPAVSPIQIPATGGSFDFNIAAVNNDPAAASVTLWCDVVLPNGSFFGPLLGPITTTMSASSSLDRDRTQLVPDNAPQGWYTYRAFVGSYPSMIYSSDSFQFEKVADVYDIPVAEWENDGEPFGSELEQLITELPQEFGLIGVTPNPFNPITTVTFALPEATHMTLEVYDISGRKLTILIDGWRDAGYHRVTFDGSQLASGIYLCRYHAGTQQTIAKMVLLK
ncbi:T9SS type A sorting domain-containing protein, partial [bacterium]|nr:T9SS type A sorting domain-containing protein [bacterium]